MSGILKRKSASGDGFSAHVRQTALRRHGESADVDLQEIRTKQTRLVPLGSHPVFIAERTPAASATPHPATGSSAARVAKGKFKPLVQSTLAFGHSPSTDSRTASSSSRDRKVVMQKKKAPIVKISSKNAAESKAVDEEMMVSEDSEDGRWGRGELSFISADKHKGFGERAKKVDRKGKGKAPRLEFIEAGAENPRDMGGMDANDHHRERRPTTPPHNEPQAEEEPDTEDDFAVAPAKPPPLVLAEDSDEDSDASMEVRNLLFNRRQSISPQNQQHPRTDDSGFAEGRMYSGKAYESEGEQDGEREDDEEEENCTAEVEAQLLCLVPDTQDQERPSPIKASLYSPESCFLGGITQYPDSPTPSSPLTALSHSPVLSPCRIAPIPASPSPSTRQPKLTGFPSVDQAWAGQHISPPKLFSPRQSRMTDFFAGPAREDDEDVVIADSQARPVFLDAIRAAVASTSTPKTQRLVGLNEDDEAEDIEEVVEEEKEVVPTSDAEDDPEIPLDEDVEFLTRLRLGRFSRQHLDHPPSSPRPLFSVESTPPPAYETAPPSPPDERFLPESMLHFLGDFDETEESLRR